MAPSRLDSLTGLSVKPKNKDRRHSSYLYVKKAKESSKRDERLRRRREEDKHPHLRVERRARNVPTTIEHKRVWDDIDVEEGDGLGLSVDIAQVKRQKTESDSIGLTEFNLQRVEASAAPEDTKDADEQASENQAGEDQADESDDESEEDELASILEESDDDENRKTSMLPPPRPAKRASSPASAASTNLSLIPDALAAKFPTLFKPPEKPKILITTSLNGTVHEQAELLTTFFPNSHYVPRTRHRYNAHHFSLREIAKFAANRDYTSLLVLAEDKKRPSGLTVIHLPDGPTFHFSISNWVEGKKLPGHGNPTDHYPEMILNNFRTPLGVLTATLFRTMFPPQPELQGRQVVTLHNQRDYIFVRRHRYVFRDKRATEKGVVGSDGKPVKGAEDLRAGLQELGPRFTLKLRRIDKGIQRGSGQEWEWKAGMEKERTKFQL